MASFKWGIIGFGTFCDKRMGPAIVGSPHNELIAIMNRNINKAKHYAEKYELEYYYDSPEEIVNNRSLDAVYIATPTYQHHSCVCMAAEQGLHALCEKPMAISLEEAQEMIAVCKKKKVKFMIAHMQRFHSCHQWVKNCIKKDRIGEIMSIKAKGEYYHSQEATAWRYIPAFSGGYAIIDAGIHIVDLLRYLTDREVYEVNALINTGPHPFPIDIISVISMRLDNGILCTINLSVVNKFPVSGFEISGTDGRLVVEDTLGQQFSGTVNLITSAGLEIYHSEMVNMYAAELEHFTQCIENDQEPTISGEEGKKDLRVCLAAYQSAREKRTIEISQITNQAYG